VAGAARDRLSADTARLTSELFDTFARAPRPAGPAEALSLVERAIAALAAAGGIEMERMTRDDGWRFLSAGRYVERLFFVSTTAGAVADSDDAGDPALLEWLLDLSDNLVTYRARYMRPPEWIAVAHLLLFDRRNPRSAAFQLAKLASQVAHLPGAGLPQMIGEIAEARAVARMAEPPAGSLLREAGALGQFLARCERLALGLSDALALRYFSHVYEPSQATAVLR